MYRGVLFFFETNYGLMQHSCNEIRDRLLNALDSEYNVSINFDIRRCIREINQNVWINIRKRRFYMHL